MNINGRDYTEGQLLMLVRAVERVLTDDRDICRNNAALRDTAVHIGLVTNEECDLG